MITIYNFGFLGLIFLIVLELIIDLPTIPSLLMAGIFISLMMISDRLEYLEDVQSETGGKE